MGTKEIGIALERAQDDARTLPAFPRETGERRTLRVAVGDPQAPLGKFLQILDRHSLLGADGRLAAHVMLVSMGDHFDWGERADRTGRSDTELLAWLAAHPADQVVLILGNHDLARVGELARFDDASFREAQVEADTAYWDKQPERAEVEFRARWGVPSWEMVARDFAAFRVEQRTLVAALLQTERFRAAHAAATDLLLCHAGVTHDELQAVGVPAAASTDAEAVAHALNEALAAAVRDWKSGPLAIPSLHRPGDASAEGGGMFYHRPARVEGEVRSELLRRRFDARRLPAGLIQAVGHVRHKKCRELLGVSTPASAPVESSNGPLRHLRVRGDEIAYAVGVPPETVHDAATLLFLDGAMAQARIEDYELLDLDARTPARTG